MTEYSVNRFEWGAKILLSLLAALLPVWFLPLPVAVEFGREATFGVIIFLATLCWFLGVLTKGEMRFQRSWVFILGVVVLLAAGVSTLFSKMPLASFLYIDPIAERYISLIEGFLLMVLAGSVMTGKKSLETTAMLMTATGILAGLFNILLIFFGISVWGKFSAMAGGASFNVTGTMNSAALFYAVLLVMALGFLTGSATKGVKSYLFAGGVLVFLANLFLINNFYSWIVVLIASVFLVGINFRSGAGGKFRFNWQYAVGAFFTALAIVMLIIRAPLSSRVSLPAEVSPSLQATVNVAKSAFGSSAKVMFFGTGPGSFGYQWLLYKDNSINQTPFWSVRFNQGSSWLSTLLVTTGILGFLSFTLFLLISFVVFLKRILFSRSEESTLASGYFLGFVGFAASAFLYPATTTVLFGLFFMTGLCMQILSVKGGEESRSWFDLREKHVNFEGPWAMFCSSLITIFALVLSVAALYLHTVSMRGVLAAQAGVQAFNQGDIDNAIASFTQAVALVDQTDMQQLLMQARIEEVRRLIERAANGEQVQQKFQETVSRAVQEFQQALANNPQDVDLWRNQGALYELLIPFIPGSERLAFDSYKKATELDPLNPIIYTDLGRAHLVYADRLLAIINQGAPDRDKQVKEREEILKDAIKAFERAVDAKQDFASAHFLLAQAHLRAGNVEQAIKSVENAKLSAPFDIGVAFQLGLLYYQTNDMGRARGEFERALSLNDNYSNARYFLGLIYDRQNDKAKALEQFTRVGQLNPDNQEIKRIVENLRAGKPALDGISPPGPAPEKRKDAPVKK